MRRLHAALRGHDPDTGDDVPPSTSPTLLLWVHATEIDSYAEVARRAGILDDAGVDAYLAESVRAARVVGLRGRAVVAARECASTWSRCGPS